MKAFFRFVLRPLAKLVFRLFFKADEATLHHGLGFIQG